MPKTLPALAVLLVLAQSVSAQDMDITLESALTVRPVHIPSLLANDPDVLRYSGLKGPGVKVQPMTDADNRALQEQNTKQAQLRAAEVRRQREANRPKPVEQTGRYVATVEGDNLDAAGDSTSQQGERAAITQGGQYAVE